MENQNEITFDLTKVSAKVFIIDDRSELAELTFRGNLHGIKGYDTLKEAYGVEIGKESWYKRIVKWIKNR